MLERLLGGAEGLLALLVEVPASGVDRRAWLTVPEAREHALAAEARAQNELVFRTFLIRALDVEVGADLALPGRAGPRVQERAGAHELLARLREGDTVRSLKSGTTFRVAAVTADGIDIEVAGYGRRVSVPVSQLPNYEKVG